MEWLNKSRILSGSGFCEIGAVTGRYYGMQLLKEEEASPFTCAHSRRTVSPLRLPKSGLS